MNFKEALIAHFSGQSVQVKTNGIEETWEPLFNRIANFTFSELCSVNCGMGCEFRLATRTIVVNGVDVPAPESAAPEFGSAYYIPDFGIGSYYYDHTWANDQFDLRVLERGIVYLNKEDAIARAKAMLIVKEG